MKWQSGRQEATKSIRKLTLWSFWRTDGYILNMPQGTTVGWHKDEVTGKKHFRFNLTLWGGWTLCRMINGVHFMKDESFLSCHFFRPDIIEHKANVQKNSYVLSIGFVI